MMSLKITATLVVVLLISYSCERTKAQEFDAEADYPPTPPSEPEGSVPPGPGSRPPRRPHGPPGSSPDSRPGQPGYARPDDRPPSPPQSPSSSDEDSSSEGSGDENSENSQRFFFGLFGGSGERVSCNYDTQAGLSCASCNQLLTCTRRGGRLKTCRGILRYCTDGRCTFRQSDACAAAAATTTVATTTGSDSTTQATQTTTGA